MLFFSERRYTLSAFYDEFVENRYADSFLQELNAAKDVEIEGFRLLEEYSNNLLAELEQTGVRLTGSVEERCLIAFLNYRTYASVILIDGAFNCCLKYSDSRPCLT